MLGERNEAHMDNSRRFMSQGAKNILTKYYLTKLIYFLMHLSPIEYVSAHLGMRDIWHYGIYTIGEVQRKLTIGTTAAQRIINHMRSEKIWKYPVRTSFILFLKLAAREMGNYDYA